jgi:hypothetical protein
LPLDLLGFNLCIGCNWQEIFPDLNTIKDKGQVPYSAVILSIHFIYQRHKGLYKQIQRSSAGWVCIIRRDARICR